MAGVVRNQGGFADVIGGYHDHAHLLVQVPAKFAVSKFVGTIKANTSKHINDQNMVQGVFRWQDGFGVFTVSRSARDAVHRYIENQVEHHRRKTFQEKYLELLDRHGIEFDQRYLWE